MGPPGPRITVDSTVTVAIEAIPWTILFPASLQPGANDPTDFILRHSSETLVRLDCRGRVQPGLATRWSADSGGRRWLLRLRPGARFRDGTRVTPKAVVELLADRAGDGRLVPWAGLRMALTSGDTGLVLVFDEPVEDLRILAAPSLTVLGFVRGDTGPYPVERTDASGTTLHPRAGPAIRLVFDDDLRDAVDAGVDLVVSRDSSVVEYAASTGRYHSAPLPWETLYLVVLPSAAREASPPTLEGLGSHVAGGLRMSSRAAGGPSWWSEKVGCEGPRPIAPSGLPPSDAIVYPNDDPAARDIAERLVALTGVDAGWTAATGASGGGRLHPVALDRGAYVRRIRAGRDAAYVVALPSTALAPCLLLLSVHSLAPWLRPDANGWAGAYPIVETRSFAIIRHRLTGRVVMDWGGGLRLHVSER